MQQHSTAGPGSLVEGDRRCPADGGPAAASPSGPRGTGQEARQRRAPQPYGRAHGHPQSATTPAHRDEDRCPRFSRMFYLLFVLLGGSAVLLVMPYRAVADSCNRLTWTSRGGCALVSAALIAQSVLTGRGVQPLTAAPLDQSYLGVDRFECVVEFEEPGAHEVAVLPVGVELLAGDLYEVAEAEPVDEGEINLQDRPDHPAGERLCPRQIHGSAVLHHEVDGPVTERRERTGRRTVLAEHHRSCAILK